MNTNKKMMFSMAVGLGLAQQIEVFASLQKVSQSKAIRDHLEKTLPTKISKLLQKCQQKSAL